MANEIGFNIEYLSVNRINAETDFDLFLQKLTNSRDLLDIFQVNKTKKKLFVIDGTECASTYPKVNKIMNHFLKLVETKTLKSNFTVVFVGYLMIVKIGKKLQNLATKFILNQPTVEESAEHVRKCLTTANYKISNAGCEIISKFAGNDICQIHHNLHQLVAFAPKNTSYIKIDLINDFFKNSMQKSNTLYLYESTQMVFNKQITLEDKLLLLQEMNNEFIFPLMIYDNLEKVMDKKSKRFMNRHKEIMESLCFYDQFSTKCLNNDDEISKSLQWAQLILVINIHISPNNSLPSVDKFVFTKVINKKALRTVTINKQINASFNFKIYNIEMIAMICRVIFTLIMNNSIEGNEDLFKNKAIDVANILRCDKMLDAKKPQFIKQLKKYNKCILFN